MPTPKTLDDTYRYLHLDLPLTRVQCLNLTQLREMVKTAWNFAVAAERERVKAEAKKDNQ